MSRRDSIPRWVIVPAIAIVLTGAPMRARAQAGSGNHELVFGMSCPFSGQAKEYGVQARLGYEVAFAMANEAGGIHGRRLRLAARDDAYEPARTVTAVRDLVEQQKVAGLVGVCGTANAAAVLPYVTEKRMLYFAPLTGAKLVRQDPPDRYVFNYRPSYAEETAAAVSYLVKVRRIKPTEIAVFMQEDGFGEAGFEGVAKAMRRFGHDPARVLRVTYKRGTVEVGAAVDTLKKNAKHVRAVVMIAIVKPAVKFIERVKSSGLNLALTNLSVVSANDLAEQLMALGPSFAEGVVVTQAVPVPTSRSTVVLRYQEALHRFAPSERADYVSLEAYVAGSILVEALRRSDRGLNSEAMVDALESIRGVDMGLGAPITFGPSEHQGSHKVWGTILDRSGSYSTIEME